MRLKVVLFNLVLLFGALLSFAVTARPLVVGTIGDEPVKEIRTFLPFAQYLARQLEHEGIREGQVVIARDIAHMADLLKTGQVDLYFDSPLVTLAVNELAGSRPIVRQWKTGLSSYHSVIFARKDSEIGSFRDLKGRIVAFEESFSSSGFLLPGVSLANLGLSLAKLRPPQLHVSPHETGCVFTGDDDNTLEWVLHGQTDAGAMSKGNFEKRAAADRAKLMIIMQTTEIPRHLVSVAATVPEPLISAIEKALFAVHQTSEGRRILEKFERTTKFDEIPQQAQARLQDFKTPVMMLLDSE